MKKINLNSLHIISFEDTIKLKKEYNEEELIQLMIDNWIGSFECHKCGRWDYCKYIKENPVNPQLSIDIKCGIAIDFITNFVNTTFDLLEELSEEQKQAYLNSAYYLTQLIINTEQVIGNFINKDYINNLNKYAPQIYGININYIDEFLKKAQKEIKKVPFLSSKRSVLFVEGKSEKIFADYFLDIEVVNYGGSGNLTYSKIEYTIKQYQDLGYSVYIQADKDGKKENQKISSIISKGLVAKDNIFCFKFDFETSIPLTILFKLINEIKFFSSDLDDFKRGYDNKIGVTKYIETKYNVSVDKPSLAQKICEYIYLSSKEASLYYNEKFLSTEIGKFWYFLKTKIVH